MSLISNILALPLAGGHSRRSEAEEKLDRHLQEARKKH